MAYMTEEKWQQILDRIKDKFAIETSDVSQATREDGSWERREWVIFTGPLGRMKVERVIRPAIVGEQRIYSKRQGTAATVTRAYSDTEKTSVLRVYQDRAGEWEEMDAKMFS